jgi:hypothetical protein
VVESLQHHDALAGESQIRSSDQPVVPAANHDGVISRGQFR